MSKHEHKHPPVNAPTRPAIVNPTKAQLSRRAFLGNGAAVAISLPFLESLAPRKAWAQATPAYPKRVLFYYVPCGINGGVREDFYPKTAGTGFEITPMMQSLAPLKSDFTFITGLENPLAKPDGPGDHASGTGAFLTCAHPFKSESVIMNGVSADQIAAQMIGKATRLPSMQLGMDGGSSAGGCDSGYSCAYARNISWTGVSTPLPKLTSPTQIFDQIFMGFDATATDAQKAKRRAYQKSVLDTAIGDATSLQPKLGKTDKAKLDEYLTGVRELERQVETVSAGGTCAMPAKPVSSSDFPTQVKVVSDLMVLAMQCDATRILTFMLGNAGSNRAYGNLTITRGHHDISHHNSDPANLAMLKQIGTWEIEQLAYLMTKMKSVTEGANNMLYNTSIFWSSEISDGNRHNHDDYPVILAGHGGGAFSGGKHVMYPLASHAKIGNLLTSMLASVGVNAKVGDATGTLPEVA
jgi:hypothetical protein